MPSPRKEPYLWTTWLPRLLVGDYSCEWAVWFKAHHQYAKVPNTRDWTTFRIAHTEMLAQKRKELEAEGYRVFTEGQGEFRLRGKTATLHGRPDLVAVSPSRALVCEIKSTTPPYPAHRAQTQLYMYALGQAVKARGGGPAYELVKEARGRAFDGLIVYQDHPAVEVPATTIDKTFVDSLGLLIRRLSDPLPAHKVPSLRECGFCDIPLAECPDRQAAEIIEGETDDF